MANERVTRRRRRRSRGVRSRRRPSPFEERNFIAIVEIPSCYSAPVSEPHFFVFLMTKDVIWGSVF